jgi:hypothetical protein
LFEIRITDLSPSDSEKYFIDTFLDILYKIYINVYPNKENKLSFNYKFIYLLASFLSFNDVSAYYDKYFKDLFFFGYYDEALVSYTNIKFSFLNCNYKDKFIVDMIEKNEANIYEQLPNYKEYLKKCMEIISDNNNIIIIVKSTYICYDNQGIDSTMLAIIFVTETYYLNEDIYELKTNLIWLKDIDFFKVYKKKIQEYPNPKEDEKIKINKSKKILNCIISIDLNNLKQKVLSTNNPQSQEQIAQINNELEEIKGQNVQIDSEQEMQRQGQQPDQQPSDQGQGQGQQPSGVKNWIYNNPKKSIGIGLTAAGIGLGITELVAPAVFLGGRKTKCKKVFKKQTKRKKVFKKKTKYKKIFKKRSKKRRKNKSKKRK